jgi:hypothetical protein
VVDSVVLILKALLVILCSHCIELLFWLILLNEDFRDPYTCGINYFIFHHKDRKKEWYQVNYEKFSVFCGVCCLLGHWHLECGAREHDEEKLHWGDFVLAHAGHGQGRGHGMGRWEEVDAMVFQWLLV